MNLKSSLRLAVLPAALMAFCSVASAQTITIGSGSGLRNTTIDIDVTYEPGGGVAGYNTVFSYDPTPLSGDPTITAGVGSCTVDNVANQITVFRTTFPASVIAAPETACTVHFPIDAAAAFAVYPLNHDPDPASTSFSDTSAATVAGTVVDGQFEVIDTPPEPPVITFTPDGGTVSLAQGGGAVGDPATNGTITVDATGGVGGGTGSYNCAVPAGFTVSNNANAAFGNGTVDMSVGCTMGASAASANMTCAVTDDNGDRNVNFTLECPAGASAVYSSAPAAGADLAQCSGAPGETVTTTLTITNTGTPANPDSAADDLAISCSVDNPANFAIIAGPTTPLEAGSSTDVTVECTIPDADEAVGTLDCNGNTYGLSALVQTLPPAIPQPNVIPANSFWSKMVLFGLLAGLGMLVVSLRRNG